MRYAIIKNDTVINIVEASEELAQQHGWVPGSSADIGDLWEGGIFIKPTININRQAMIEEIDKLVENIYDKPMRLSKEYEQREAAALAYKNAGYTGAVPARVLGFSVPAGMSPKDATDLILSQATTLRSALDQLGDLRMRKYEVMRLPTDEAALAAHAEIIATIKQIGASIA
jgi:hypothetical protein